MTKQLKITELGNPILRKEAGKVKNIIDEKIQNLIDDMIYTVSNVKGVGIAAPQVSKSFQIFIICSNPNSRYPDAPEMKAAAIINPKIISTSYEEEFDWEGCLSIPKLRGLVPRHTSIDVSYTDRFGNNKNETFTDFPARIFQHEYDHLNGLVFLDRIESSEDLITENEYVKLINEQMDAEKNK
ncbi:MAG: peptide deformylase [Thermodesulfobacteriota bacterium]